MSTENYETKVGSKGEIYLKKKIRDKLKIMPNDTIIVSIKDNQLIIKRKKRFKDIAREAKMKVRLTLEENAKLDTEINEAFEN